MEAIDIRKIIETKKPNFFSSKNEKTANLLLRTINSILHVNEINQFLENNQNKYSEEFIDAIFDHFDFSYDISDKERRRIPNEGKLLVVSNHPLGGLDGLILLKAILEVRKDVKIVANDVLLKIENLSDLLLPFDVFSFKQNKLYYNKIDEALKNDEAVIFFPSGEVSRYTSKGIKDSTWKRGAISFARKHSAPILPIYVDARNSMMFYTISKINMKASTFLLAHEMMKKRSNSVKIRIGKVIPASNIISNSFTDKTLSSLLKKHVYKLKKNKRGVFTTENTIIHPVDKQLLKLELQDSQLIGHTRDSKKIFLVEYEKSENIMKEIGRLREITFRSVGEGTGKSIDLDKYDKYYKHIVLWDDDQLEIVGSYRFGLCSDIIEDFGKSGLYNSEQFLLMSNFDQKLNQSLEMGRSFVQKRYWGTFALDYMWQGIAAYLSHNPEIKYLWGAVSISNTYSEKAKNLIIYYYKKWFGNFHNLAVAKTSYIISKKQTEELRELFSGNSKDEDFKILKRSLKELGFTIPTLYRNYVDLCEYGGSTFIDFSVDINFANSIDGLILVDLELMTDDKKNRYFEKRSIHA